MIKDENLQRSTISEVNAEGGQKGDYGKEISKRWSDMYEGPRA